jgi:exodeoxyribonuclease V alpha subunit
MHGGMKVYAGAPAAARHYVEADRGRADDYYLTEGAGLARRFVATDGRVRELEPMTGDSYETWVAGRDPATGEPRGHLRGDEHAVRFVEVVVNGPKTWSLAAALHPDIATAYEAAQDRAAEQVIAWLSEHASTRVGPRGGQVQVPLQVLEAATVRHYTSRAEDPHWHLHLQLLSRVHAAGKWRGLHTVGVRDFLGAINGIGHAAMACDPELNAAFAAHGYSRGTTGEILQLTDYVGPMSARNVQIARNVDGYERDWAAAHPGEHPGPALRRAWDARAWAEGRPDKVTGQPGQSLADRWRAQLHGLGYRAPRRPATLASTPVGALDRDAAAERVLSRLAAGRSAWNPADVRGEAERLIAASGILAEAAVRIELAEDLTARAMGRCVPLLDRGGVPEHVRAWTSQPVLDVEADLTARLAARAATGAASPDPALPREPAGAEWPVPPARLPDLEGLDRGQTATVGALAADRPLVVVEGAAGAGKTTTLAAARRLLEAGGRRLVVVTPTLKAAKVAASEVGTAAGSAASFAFAYGWRWNQHGAWTRLALGETDPVTGRLHTGPAERTRLRRGDLLVIDEAGMLDQDTARAVLTVADEAGARVALLGDRHQLAAVGRGGVLDLAVDQLDPADRLTLESVHRFIRTDGTGTTTPDTDYAALTLAMRTGHHPGAVFDALLARGQIRLHPDAAALQDAVAGAAAPFDDDGRRVAVVVDTREQAAELNAALRDRLVAAGRVDDTRVAVTAAGERIGAGDRITTRRNDRNLDVANRDTWVVTAVGRRGGLLVTAATATPAAATGDVSSGVTPACPGSRVLPADYVTAHVELAYATTAHGAQGDTVAAAHLMIGEHTGAAAAYVGMTRGRQANTAHLITTDLAEARQQWIAVFTRDRADLGPAHAAHAAAAEAARYGHPRPLEQVLADLDAAWTAEQRCRDRLAFQEPIREALRNLVAAQPDSADQLAALDDAYRQAARAAEQAQQRAETSGAAISAEADRIRDALLHRWDAEGAAARQAARVVLDGPGRLGLKRVAVARAGERLVDWADRWRPHLPQLPIEPGQVARVTSGLDRRALWAALDASARSSAEQAHPKDAELRAAADAAQGVREQAGQAVAEAHRRHEDRLALFGGLAWTADAEARLADVDRDNAATRHQLAATQARIAQLSAEPALLAQPADRLTQERDAWRARRDAELTARRPAVPLASSPGMTSGVRPPEPVVRLTPRPGPGPGIGR